MNEVNVKYFYLLTLLLMSNVIKCSFALKKNKKLRVNILKSGTSLKQGESLMSANKKYTAILRNDGNFVLYENKGNRVKPIWSSRGTRKGNYKLTMKKNGNVEITNRNNKRIWSTNTAGKGVKGHLLFLENDGNLSVYDGKGNTTWSTKTSKKQRKKKKYGSKKSSSSKNTVKKSTVKKILNRLNYLKRKYNELKKSVKTYKRLTSNKKVHNKWKKYIKKMKKRLSGSYLRKSKVKRRYHTRIRRSDYPRRLRRRFLKNLQNRKKWYKRIKGDIPSNPQKEIKAYRKSKSYERNTGSQNTSYRRKSYGPRKQYRRNERQYPMKQRPPPQRHEQRRRSYQKRPNRDPYQKSQKRRFHRRPFKKHRRPLKKRRFYKKTPSPFSKRLMHRKKSSPKFIRNKLISGDQIYSNQYLMSKNRRYIAKLEKDGSFAVYRISGRSKKLKWSTKTSGKGVEPYRLRLKSNGNLIIFDSRNYKIWSSNTNRAKSIHTYSLIMKNNGNLVLMVRNKQVWSTNTWEN